MIAEDWTLAIPGIVFQELLSGIRSPSEFERLRAIVEGFPVLTATLADHLSAAEIANACRAKGIAASAVDCLISAQAISAGFFLFTFDRDFSRIASCCSLVLWSTAGVSRRSPK